MKKLLNWIIYSSKDSNKFSLTIKGIGAFIIASILPVLAFLGYVISPDDIAVVTESIAYALKYILDIVSVLMIAWGALRKIYLTIADKHKTK